MRADLTHRGEERYRRARAVPRQVNRSPAAERSANGIIEPGTVACTGPTGQVDQRDAFSLDVAGEFCPSAALRLGMPVMLASLAPAGSALVRRTT